LSCEYEGYYAIWKDLVSPDTKIAEDKAGALSRATTPEEAATIERVFGYCAIDRLSVAQETLDDPLTSRGAKMGAYISRDSVARGIEPYRLS